jgi:Mn-dependent DtxR family transcriptional regulator
MLTELLRLLEQNHAEYDLHELGRLLGVQPSAVAGMLQTLIHKGRVVEMGADCGICATCGIRGHCDIPVTRAKRYKIATI